MFRSRSHHFAIETGRHTIPITPVNERLCQLCKGLLIDDEMHMLLSCEFHFDERSIMYTEIPTNLLMLPPDQLFCELLNTPNETVIRSVAKYIHRCFEKRKLAE